MGKLSGYKTYIVAGVTVIGAVAGYLTGDLTLQSMLALVVPAILGATLRNGISTEAQK